MLIERTGATSFDVDIFEWQGDMLANLTEQIRDMLLEGTSPSLRRLYPTAYPGDVEANAEYDELVHDQLLASQLDGLDVIETSLGHDGPTEMSEDDLHRWMQAVNSIRLALGTRLDVSEADYGPDSDDAEGTNDQGADAAAEDVAESEASEDDRRSDDEAEPAGRTYDPEEALLIVFDLLGEMIALCVNALQTPPESKETPPTGE